MINEKEYKRLVDLCQNDPVKFVEEIWGCKLYWYQKVLFKTIIQCERLKHK